MGSLRIKFKIDFETNEKAKNITTICFRENDVFVFFVGSKISFEDIKFKVQCMIKFQGGINISNVLILLSAFINYRESPCTPKYRLHNPSGDICIKGEPTLAILFNM